MSELIITERANIVAIADAVRSKTGTSDGLTLGGIVDGINSISDEASGGGSSVGTCTLVFNINATMAINIIYTILDSTGVTTTTTTIAYTSKSVSIQNVICNSFVVLCSIYEGDRLTDVALMIDGEEISRTSDSGFIYFTVPNEPNATTYVSLEVSEDQQ